MTKYQKSRTFSCTIFENPCYHWFDVDTPVLEPRKNTKNISGICFENNANIGKVAGKLWAHKIKKP